ncbi:MAG: DNA translocase FtsK [Thermovirgaceae bacterium]|nr:DNA translocase FtsK [Thermovirgaceae bacterium]
MKIIRRKVKSSPGKKDLNGRTNAKPRSPFMISAVFALFLLCLYVLATIFLFRTGTAGNVVHSWTLGTLGGSVIVLLFFGTYISLAWLFGLTVPGAWRQSFGTAVLFLCCALFLGLYRLSGMVSAADLLQPGSFGLFLAESLYRNIGPLGAVFAGFAGICIAMGLYGVLSRKTVQFFGSLFCRFKKPVSADLHPKTAAEPDHVQTTRENAETDLNRKAVSSGKILIPEAIIEDQNTPMEFKRSNSIDPELHFPVPLEVFGEPDDYSFNLDKNLLARQGESIISTLDEFGISAELAETVIGPTVIQYRIQLAPGIKVSRVSGLANDLAVSLGVPSLRVEAPIPGKTYIGIEIPNPERKPVNLRTVLEHPSFQESDNDLSIPVGVGVDGRHLTIGLEKMPHLLVAGTTGSGKSVFVSCCIAALCSQNRPEDLRLLLIDPKRVEMKMFERLPHNIVPPVVESRQAVHALGWAVREMERRYEMFAQARVRNLKTFNARALPLNRLPYIVIVIDELADLMFTSPREVEDFICRLAQMARATGIHLIIATQRPSVNVVTGLIKANIPARVAFELPSQTDSRTIIDIAGAERLLGSGDMLFLTPRLPKPLRIQSPWIEEIVIQRLMDYLSSLFGDPVFFDIDMHGEEVKENGRVHLDDSLLEEAMNMILHSGIASASRLQRQLRIGFTRAARLIDTLEQIGIVGPQEGSKPRDILVDEDDARHILGESLNGN